MIGKMGISSCCPFRRKAFLGSSGIFRMDNWAREDKNKRKKWLEMSSLNILLGSKWERGLFELLVLYNFLLLK
jgi:hypothetical protein